MTTAPDARRPSPKLQRTLSRSRPGSVARMRNRTLASALRPAVGPGVRPRRRIRHANASRSTCAATALSQTRSVAVRVVTARRGCSAENEVVWPLHLERHRRRSGPRSRRAPAPSGSEPLPASCDAAPFAAPSSRSARRRGSSGAVHGIDLSCRRPVAGRLAGREADRGRAAAREERVRDAARPLASSYWPSPSRSQVKPVNVPPSGCRTSTL